MNNTLLVMAAGMGSRFGQGIKQLTPIGPGGELIIDYSIHDAKEAGFNKVVFVIRKDIEQAFHDAIGYRISKVIDVEYAYQEKENLPEGFTCPPDRTKPWGTGHAIMAAKDLIHEPFAVINADDYYGKEGFKLIHDYMVNEMNIDSKTFDCCMAGFILKNTLSDNGGVTRGICETDKDGYLTKVTETFDINYAGNGMCSAKDENDNPITLSAESCTSMNCWGFVPQFIDSLEVGFVDFLKNLKPGDIKSEYLLPTYVGQCIERGHATVKALTSHDKWFGVTYQADKQKAYDAINALIKAGEYPEKLYE